MSKGHFKISQGRNSLALLSLGLVLAQTSRRKEKHFYRLASSLLYVYLIKNNQARGNLLEEK